MFALLSAAVGSAAMNFTHVLIGNWTVNTSRLTPDGTEELIPTQGSIRILAGLRPGYLEGAIFSEDADGVLVATHSLQITRKASDNATFSLGIATADVPDTFDRVADAKFTPLGDGLMTAAGRAGDLGSYAITILSPTMAELTLVAAETKEVTIYRLLKEAVQLPPKSFLSRLGPMLIPLAISMMLQRFMQRRRAAQPQQEAPKDKTD